MRSDRARARLQCDDVEYLLPDVAAGRATLPFDAARHVDRCLRCQAEVVQYRKVLRSLHALRTEVLEPAPGLLTDILAGIEGVAERRALRDLVRGRRAAYLGGIAVATAAGAGALALVHSRRARLRLAS